LSRGADCSRSIPMKQPSRGGQGQGKVELVGFQGGSAEQGTFSAVGSTALPRRPLLCSPPHAPPRASGSFSSAPPRLTARENGGPGCGAQPIAAAPLLPSGEALAMLARRSFRPEVGRPDLPFAARPGRRRCRASRRAPRPLLLPPLPARCHPAPGRLRARRGDALPHCSAGEVAGRRAGRAGHPGSHARDRYRFVRRATSFGPTLEWYVRASCAAGWAATLPRGEVPRPRAGRRSGRGRGDRGQAHLPGAEVPHRPST